MARERLLILLGIILAFSTIIQGQTVPSLPTFNETNSSNDTNTSNSNNTTNVNNEEEDSNQNDSSDNNNEIDEDSVANDNATGLVEIFTNAGTIRGKESHDWNNVKQFQFLGIPYAEPPVGALRFRDSIPKRPFARPFYAVHFGPSCPQIGGDNSSSLDENCLTLNIFAPRVPSRRGRVPDQSSLLPVMVWIHGGAGERGLGFRSGSGAVDPSPLVQKGVIVVTMNYRLGVLGFLTLDDPMISGNQGLKDQLEALKWVNRNIMAFGGNPDKVTLFGTGAGAVSAHLHQLSPRGQNLFHGVIVQSNSALTISQTLTKSNAVVDSRRFVSDVGCEGQDGNAVLKCLQDKTAQDLLNRTLPNFDVIDEIGKELNGTGGYVFGPVIDAESLNPFLPEHPLAILTQGSQKDIPIIAGVNENEGSQTMSSLWNVLGDVSANWTLFGPKLFFASKASDAVNNEQEQIKANVTRHFYAGQQNFSQFLKQELTDMFSDAEHTSPMIRTAELQSSTQQEPVYLYQMTHKPSRSRVEKYGKSTGANTEDFGAAHGDELYYLFENVDNFTDAISTEEDKAVRDKMTTLWTNFAKHQDPTLFQEDDLPTWLPFEQTSTKYLEIKPEPEIKEGMFKERMYFWRRMFWDDLERSGNNPSVPVQPANPVLYQLGLGNQGVKNKQGGQNAPLPYPYAGSFGGYPNSQSYPNGFFG